LQYIVLHLQSDLFTACRVG